jgi:hypothetical protein
LTFKKRKLAGWTFLFLTAISVFACRQDNKTIQGDLYFSFLRFGSFYNQPDSVINKFKIYADTVNYNKLNSFDKQVLTMYKTLKKENLLFNPFIELRLDNDSIVKLYLDKSDYEKIKIYKRQELQDQNKKIRINILGSYIGNKMLHCKKLISVDKVDGQTLEIEKKFKIDDYN